MSRILNLLRLLALAGAVASVSAQGDDPTANTTTPLYQVQSTDTIFTIAKTVNRGACDIARANRMADAELLKAGMTLLIPSPAPTPDDTSCLLVNQNATATCILGGPHTYTTTKGDTVEKIALAKLNITVASLLAGIKSPITSNITATSEIPSGTTLKVPQCDPSQCIVRPYRFTFGTYKDLAAQFGSTVGQIFAYNTGYNYSHATTPGTEPVITMPMNCAALSDNVTVIS